MLRRLRPQQHEALPARYRLNIDQEIPPREDEVYLYFRWRFYYEGAASISVSISESPRETYHVEWQFGDIEYSVPKAPEGTPPEHARHTLTSNFTVADMLKLNGGQCGGSVGCEQWDKNNGSRPIQFLMLGFHCHSPSHASAAYCSTLTRKRSTAASRPRPVIRPRRRTKGTIYGCRYASTARGPRASGRRPSSRRAPGCARLGGARLDDGRRSGCKSDSQLLVHSLYTSATCTHCFGDSNGVLN